MKTSVVSKLVEEVLSLGISKTVTKTIMKKTCNKRHFSPSMFHRKSSADITPVTCLSNATAACCCGKNIYNRDNRRSSTRSNEDSQESESYFLSLIFFAIQYNNDELLEEVLERSLFDANQQNEDGITALHFAAIVGSTNCISVLQQHGCCVNMLDIRGQSPLYYAKIMENHDAVMKLRECGAE